MNRKRDLALYILTLTMSLTVAFYFLPMLAEGEIHGYEPNLAIRIIEFILILIPGSLAVERLISWVKRYPGGDLLKLDKK